MTETPIEDDEARDIELINNYIDARDRALAVHEAGHTVVAHAFGAQVSFVEINLMTRNGASNSSTFGDQVKNIAVCVAGCRAEYLLDAHGLRRSKIGDYRLLRKMLLDLPERERRVSRAEGYRLADETLKANVDIVRRVADELMRLRGSDEGNIVRIDGDKLAALLAD
jgi:hypothetical protein